MVRSEQILKDILLKMNYDSSKTLNENLSEQYDVEWGPSDFKQGLGANNKIKPNYWQEGCKYPEMAMRPPSIDGVDGPDAMIRGFCYYPTSSNSVKGGTSGRWIPANSEVVWVTQEDKNKYILDRIQKSKSPDNFWHGLTPDEIASLVYGLLVDGTVRRFSINGKEVVGFFMREGGTATLESISFGGYYYKETKQPYVQPEWIDRRDGWDKFWDEWGTTVQIGLAVLIGALSVFGGPIGIAGSALLWTEIGLELGVGAIIAQREMEKGNTAGAAFEMLFALTPWLKGVKAFRGLDNNMVKSITKQMDEAGITIKSSEAEIKAFYEGLSSTDKEIFSRMLLDSSDELTEEVLIQALGKQHKEFMYQYVKQNPELIKSLPFYKKVWAKELGVNGAIMLANFVFDYYFGEELTPEEEMALMGIYQSLPENLAQDVFNQTLMDESNTQAAKENLDKIYKDLEQKTEDYKSQRDSLANITVVYDVLNDNGVNVNNPLVADTPTIPDGFKEVSIEEFLDIIDQVDAGVIDDSNIKEMRASDGTTIYLYKESN